MNWFDVFCLSGIACLLILGGIGSIAIFLIKQIRLVVKDLFDR